MEIKQVRIFTTKMENPSKEENQPAEIEVLAVALAHETLNPTPDDAEVKIVEFITNFPTSMFQSPAGYGLAIEVSMNAFVQYLNEEKAKTEATSSETEPEALQA